MKVLVADKFEKSGIDGLQRRRLRGRLRARSQGRRADERDRDDAARTCWSCAARRSPTPMLDAGRLSLIVRAGAGYNTIDVGGGVAARHLRLELSRQERHRRGRAGVRADPRARSARARQRRRAARRQVEQEGVLEGAGAVRPDARPARHRQHRAGDDPARRRLRHDRRRLEPPVRRASAGR